MITALRVLLLHSFFVLAGLLAAVPSIHAESLRELAGQKGVWIGTCTGARLLQNNAEYANILGREFNMVVAENDMKFHRIHPAADRYNFEPADAIVDFAETNNMKVRGHTLVWHRATPKWLEEKEWSKDQLNQILHDHIQTVAGRYHGKIVAWDVVNEAINDDGTWRESLWYKTLGKEYLFNAFRWAREADPDALLFYNDYSAEALNKKSDAIYALAKEMKENNIPLDGIGFQLHVKAESYPSIDSIQNNIQRLSELGLQIHFTEVDVRIKLPATEEKLQQQAECYRKLLELCLSEKQCTAFLTWGFTDKYSWVEGHFEGYGDALLFNDAYQPKPSYYALQDALQEK